MYQHQKTTVYTCQLACKEMRPGIEQFGKFSSGIGDNFEVVLSRRYPSKSGATNMDILIEKTNHLPIEAHMELNFHGTLKCVTKSVDDWRKCVYFHNVNLKPHSLFYSSCTISLEITWILTGSFVPQAMPLFLDLSVFSMSSTLSDLTIQIDDEKIFTHKLILAAASPVWLSGLTMKEAEENTIIIKDVEVDVMKAILKFLYTGKPDVFDEFEMAMKVLVVADAYAMDNLKFLIEQKLIKWVTFDTVLKIIDHADNHRAKNLVRTCIKFIIDQRISGELTSNECFDSYFISKPQLLGQLTFGIAAARHKESLRHDKPLQPTYLRRRVRKP